MEVVSHTRKYLVREAAYKSLQELGVEIDRPVLEEPAQPGDQFLVFFRCHFPPSVREKWRIGLSLLVVAFLVMRAARPDPPEPGDAVY